MGGPHETDEGGERRPEAHPHRCGDAGVCRAWLPGASLRSICAAAHVTTGALYFLFAGKGEFFERALGPSFDQVALSLRTYYRREQTSLTLGEETLKSPTSPDGRQCTGTLAGS